MLDRKSFFIFFDNHLNTSLFYFVQGLKTLYELLIARFYHRPSIKLIKLTEESKNRNAGV